jgi:hypothetical protein
LKKDILRYYQELTPDIQEAERLTANEILKLTDFWATHADRDFKANFLDPAFKARVSMILNLASKNAEQYADAVNLANKISEGIEKEYDEK